MRTPDLQLVDPSGSYREEFIAYCEEFRAAGEPFVHGDLPDATRDFAELIGRWIEQARGKGLPEGYVPMSRYWLMSGGRILGTIRLRHLLNEALAHEGGHIGFDVRPSERNRGHATRMLAMVLEKAREMGLRRVLVTCDKDNRASAQVIRKNGGSLQNEVVSLESGKAHQQYWIDL